MDTEMREAMEQIEQEKQKHKERINRLNSQLAVMIKSNDEERRKVEKEI